MANTCNGDYFSVKQLGLYRCFGNGVVMSVSRLMVSPGKITCPVCHREIYGVSHGEQPLQQKQITTYYVELPRSSLRAEIPESVGRHLAW